MSLPSIRPITSRLAAARELPLRAAVLVGLVLIAYNYSLLTLARSLTLQSPLAYLALVPIIALGLAVARIRIEPKGLPIHDRQLDWIVGLGLLGLTAAILIILPNSTSAGFWLQRVDLLTLPLFVAGLIALLFGVRRLWSLKGPIGFLLLAWPVPYTLFLASAAGQFTEITARIVGLLTNVVPVARPGRSDDTLFFVSSGINQFSVSIGSACAGMNGFIGFLLMGTALLFVVRGTVLRRVAWLVIGLALVFALNVLRIMAILVVGATLGQEAAFDVLHPFAGMVIFTIGVLIMVALVPRFGLRFVGAADLPAQREATSANPVRRIRPALFVAVGVSVLLAVSNAAYARFEAISSGLADARLHSFDARKVHIPGWESRFVASLGQATQYFGASATWDRVMWLPEEGASLSSNRTVYVDVLTTDDSGALAEYGLEACYRFHGYEIASVTTVDIGAGVQAQIIDYHNTTVGSDWSALWWEWPITQDGKTRYERIVAQMGSGPTGEYAGVAAADIGTQVPRFVTTDRFLATLGRAMVRSQLREAA
jgi:exosortase